MRDFEFKTTFPTQDLKVDLHKTFEKIALEDRLEIATKPTDPEDSRDDLDHETREAGSTRGSTESFPLRTIILQKESRGSSEYQPTIGYVQLCYDQRKETIVPMMEISDGRSKTGRRISMMTAQDFPSLAAVSTSPTHSTGTVSTLSLPDGMYFSLDDDHTNFDPIVLGEDVNMYLLHDSREPNHCRSLGCADGLQKFLEAKMIGLKGKPRKNTLRNPSSKRRVYRQLNGM